MCTSPRTCRFAPSQAASLHQFLRQSMQIRACECTPCVLRVERVCGMLPFLMTVYDTSNRVCHMLCFQSMCGPVGRMERGGDAEGWREGGRERGREGVREGGGCGRRGRVPQVRTLLPLCPGKRFSVPPLMHEHSGLFESLYDFRWFRAEGLEAAIKSSSCPQCEQAHHCRTSGAGHWQHVLLYNTDSPGVGRPRSAVVTRDLTVAPAVSRVSPDPSPLFGHFPAGIRIVGFSCIGEYSQQPGLLLQELYLRAADIVLASVECCSGVRGQCLPALQHASPVARASSPVVEATSV